MKKSVYTLILLGLAAIAIYLYFTRTSSTLASKFNKFEIDDTSSVTRIFIADYEGNTADLTRMPDNSWMINGKYRARQDGIDNLLYTFNGVRIKETVPETMVNTIIREMAARSIKVEVYTGNSEAEKIYYVGNPTSNHLGTYMLLELDGEKSDRPYVTHIRGFAGFLTPRFFTDMNLWRDRTIFSLKPDDIKSLVIKYNEQPEKSFRLTNEDGNISVFDLSDGKKVEPTDKEALTEYLSRYAAISFEAIAEKTPICNIDSIIETSPLHEIDLEDSSGKKISLRTYLKAVKESMILNPETGENYEHDLDRLYALIDGKELVIMQWGIIDPLLAYNSDFRIKAIVDK